MLAGSAGTIDGQLARRMAGELLVWTARRAVKGTAAGDPPIAAMTDQSWGEFLHEGMRHALLPLAHTSLEPFADGLPPAMERDLRTTFEMNLRRAMTLAGELVGFLRLLAEVGVEAVPWKGPLLAERAYGDIGQRQFFDLDVLIRATDLPAARRALFAAGFRSEKPMTEAQLERYVAHQGELELIRESDGLWLELHTAIVPTYYARGRPTDDLWARLRPAQVVRSTVRALDPVDELEALCIHGSKHRWDRLAWIVDVALMARLLDESEWVRLATQARAHGTRRMVDLGLQLALRVAGARLPDWLVRGARSDSQAITLVRQVERDLFDPQLSRFDALLFHTRMRERQRDRARYLFNVAFRPSGADWGPLALPRALFPLYAVSRPIRLGLKYGRRLVPRQARSGVAEPGRRSSG